MSSSLGTPFHSFANVKVGTGGVQQFTFRAGKKGSVSDLQFVYVFFFTFLLVLVSCFLLLVFLSFSLFLKVRSWEPESNAQPETYRVTVV